MPPFERHVFICTNQRPPESPKGCCAAKGSEAVRDAFKKELATRGLLGRVRPNSAGCLDACDHGVSVVIYPDNVWYAHVKPEDVREIIEEHILGGRPIERLRMPLSPPLPRRLPMLA